MQELTQHSSMPNSTPIGAKIRVCGPKTEILLNFRIITPAGAYPLRDFYKIYNDSSAFSDVLAVKIWMDLLKGLRSYGAFQLRGGVFPNFQCPLAAKLYVKTECFRGPRTCSKSSITMPNLMGLGPHPLADSHKC